MIQNPYPAKIDGQHLSRLVVAEYIKQREIKPLRL